MSQELLAPSRVFVFGQAVDMRKSFDGLYCLVRYKLEEEPTSGDLFLFLNRRRNYVKGLLWDRTGFVIVAKRLESGQFKLRNKASKVTISRECLRKFLDGVSVGGVEIMGSNHSSSGHANAATEDVEGRAGLVHRPAASSPG